MKQPIHKQKPAYSDSLPAAHTPSLLEFKAVCVHLDNKGNQCKAPAEIDVVMHEIMKNNYSGWHVAYFCDKHAKARGFTLKESQNYN